MQINMTMTGDKELKYALNATAESVKDLRPVWDDVLKVFHEHEQEHFKTKGRGMWRPLTANYARWKAKNFPGRPLMVLTGELKRSLTVKGAPNALHIPAPLSFTVGTLDPKARWHANNKKKPRNVLSKTKEMFDDIVMKITKHIQRNYSVRAGK